MRTLLLSLVLAGLTLAARPTSAQDNGTTTGGSLDKLCESWWETYWSCANTLHDLHCGGSGGLEVFSQPGCFDARAYQDARTIRRIQIRAYLMYQTNGCAARNGGLGLPSPY